MKTLEEIKLRINTLIKEYYNEKNRLNSNKNFVYPLMADPFDYNETINAVDSLLSGNLTMNQFARNKIIEFEELWSEYLKIKESVMVNSGSSANLLALNVLSNPLVENHLVPGDEIITPAVTWSTTVYPIWNIGAIPVFVDVDPQTLTISPESIRNAITEKTKAVMIVHLLGNPCDMDEIVKICKEHNLFLIEDTCEAHGAEYNSQKVGTFGDISTFSFFYSHHLTSIEGGAICTDNDLYAELGRIMRSQGVLRNVKNKEAYKKKFIDMNKYGSLDENYLFANMGFNLRPTEINGAFGIEQISKFDDVLDKRRKTADLLMDRLEKFSEYFILPTVQKNSVHSWFAIPLIVKPESGLNKEQFLTYLSKNNIEHRPIMSGNILLQPIMEIFPHKKHGSFHSATMIHENGFLIGNNQNISIEMIDRLVKIIEAYFE